VKDGAHTHGHHGGGGGLALAAVVAVVALASGLAETLARVLPILVISVAVIAGLAIAGWVTRAVLTYRARQYPGYPDVTAAARPDPLAAADDAASEVHPASTTAAASAADPRTPRYRSVLRAPVLPLRSVTLRQNTGSGRCVVPPVGSRAGSCLFLSKLIAWQVLIPPRRSRD